MKTKTRLFKSLLTLSTIGIITNGLVISNYLNKSTKSYTLETWYEADAKLIGGKQGTFVYADIDNYHVCKICSFSDDFLFEFEDNYFDFNGGHFTDRSINYRIEWIRKWAFYNKDFNGCNIVIPNTIKSIESEAFCSDRGIKSIEFKAADSLKINERAFYKSNIESIKFEGNNIQIGKEAFLDTNIKSLNFKTSSMQIDERAFAGCNGLEENTIKFPTNNYFLKEQAFVDTNINKIDLTQIDDLDDSKNAITIIDINSNFNWNNGWPSVIFKNDEIRNKYLNSPYWMNFKGYLMAKDTEEEIIKVENAFNDIPNLSAWIKYVNCNDCTLIKTSMELEDKTNSTFNFNNGKITREGIDYTITSLGEQALAGLHDSQISFDKTTLIVPSVIKKINNKAFFSYLSTPPEVKSIKIEDGVEEIGESAFEHSYILGDKTIKLPNSIKYVGPRAFKHINMVNLDLSELDHIIDVDYRVMDKTIGIISSDTRVIYVKNQEMINKFKENKFWSAATFIMKIK